MQNIIYKNGFIFTAQLYFLSLGYGFEHPQAPHI
jgi:hypothetical protein